MLEGLKSLSTDHQSAVEDKSVGLLAQLIDQHTRGAEDVQTAVSGFSLHRRSHAHEDNVHCLYSMGLSVLVQGSKQIKFNDKELTYDAGYSVLTTIEFPASYHVTQASVAEPMLGLMLSFDPAMVMQLATDLQLPSAAMASQQSPFSMQKLDFALTDALVRLVRLLEEPLLLAKLAPLILQEIILRLLTGPHGLHLQQLVLSSSSTSQISKAIAWIKQNYKKSIHVDELAARFHKSPSAFRHTFKAFTGVSPVQFQKHLRLQEARQLMLNKNMAASQAAGLVGYESISQFSREYSRLFGAPPVRDICSMRQNNAGKIQRISPPLNKLD